MAERKPVSALLSQMLVAYTVEFDNAFEERMSQRGYTEREHLSLVLWATLFRFLTVGGTSVADLASTAGWAKERIVHVLGCLERWGYATLRPGPGDPSPRMIT